jgi:hypothetical protein
VKRSRKFAGTPAYDNAISLGNVEKGLELGYSYPGPREFFLDLD